MCWSSIMSRNRRQIDGAADRPATHSSVRTVQNGTELCTTPDQSSHVVGNTPESNAALLARVMKEMQRPNVVKSARAAMTRLEFEAKPEWRATIRRRMNLVFILEGLGKLAGKFY